MEKRVKIFVGISQKRLETDINDFLIITKGRLHDIKYQILASDYNETHIEALVIYTPQGASDEEGNQTKKENQEGYERIQGRITPLWVEGRSSC